MLSHPVDELVLDSRFPDVLHLGGERFALFGLSELAADDSSLLGTSVQLAEEEVSGVVQRWTLHP